LSKTGCTNVVVGAASGMGAAVAALFARRGPLLLADRDADALARVADALEGDVTTRVCDLTDPIDTEELVDACGRPGAVVVTAGLSPSMADGRRIYEVNLRGLERLIRGLAPAVDEATVAVVFASTAGHMLPGSAALDAVVDDPLSESFFDDLAAAGIDPQNPLLAYPVSKRGVIRLARRHAAAWGAKGARILSLSPGIIDTSMGRLEAENQPAMAHLVESSALGRIGRPQEVATVAAFLASEASSFMTGVDVLVDGGSIASLGLGDAAPAGTSS
jgi:NAD(P)-dependent dehydrogenase (short-subunit alcohol dehydrogenase family)